MSMGLLGRKVGMTRVFTESGEQVSVTVVKTGPCVVIGKRTMEVDKYSALRIGFGERRKQKITKPREGEAKKSGQPAPDLIREFRVTPEEAAKFEVGQVLDPSKMFAKGQQIDVVGTSRGRGFQGVVKMHHMAGFVEGHGTHEYYRHPGAIGQRKTPGRVYKNKRMPGHMGLDRISIQNLTLVGIEGDLLLIGGSVPGHATSLVTVKPTVKKLKIKKEEPKAEKKKEKK
jgi:large subunit ribosomal protein L3